MSPFVTLRPAALDRPGRLPARQPRPRGHAAGGGPHRAGLRPPPAGRACPVRRRAARRRPGGRVPAPDRLPPGPAAGRDDGRRGAGRVVPDRLRDARRARRGRPGRHRARRPAWPSSTSAAATSAGWTPTSAPPAALGGRRGGRVVTLRLADTAERGDLGAFIARVVRLDQAATVRLRSARRTRDGVGAHPVRRARHPLRARRRWSPPTDRAGVGAAHGAGGGARARPSTPGRRRACGPASCRPTTGWERDRRRARSPSSTGSPSAGSRWPASTRARWGRRRRCWTRPCSPCPRPAGPGRPVKVPMRLPVRAVRDGVPGRRGDGADGPGRAGVRDGRRGCASTRATAPWCAGG